MKIAVVGTGISGMLAAYLLCRDHDLTVFEANDYIGGHTNTANVEQDGQTYAVDTGFIVFNDRTYPNFIRLLQLLGVESQQSLMSFSVRCETTGLEYNPASLNALFTQRKNLFRPSFYRMLLDVLRFNRNAPRLFDQEDETLTLGDYLAREKYSSQFVNHYIVPMGAAIWSAESSRMLEFPALYFARFLRNHGLLQLTDQPTWRVIKGGSARYAEKLVQPYRDRIRLNCPVESVRRVTEGVELKPVNSDWEHFDAVVFASHSDQTLRMLADPTQAEKDILGALPYQANDVVLHTDASVLPTHRRAWAAWNYHVVPRVGPVAVTYNMNILQSLESSRPFCVTLNRSEEIKPEHDLKRINYAHPVFTPAGMAAQKRHAEISGLNGTYYCGAYWGFGFHEDGVRSALAVGKSFGLDLDDCENRPRSS